MFEILFITFKIKVKNPLFDEDGSLISNKQSELDLMFSEFTLNNKQNLLFTSTSNPFLDESFKQQSNDYLNSNEEFLISLNNANLNSNNNNNNSMLLFENDSTSTDDIDFQAQKEVSV